MAGVEIDVSLMPEWASECFFRDTHQCVKTFVKGEREDERFMRWLIARYGEEEADKRMNEVLEMRRSHFESLRLRDERSERITALESELERLKFL